MTNKSRLPRLAIVLAITALIHVFSVVSIWAADVLPADVTSGTRHLKTIIVDNYQPYTFINEKSEPDGFSVDIARAVTSAMNTELEISPGPWQQAIKALQDGTIDFLPMMAYTTERDKIFDFSVPHTIAYDAIFTKKGSAPFASLKELSGKTVLVMKSDVAHEYLVASGLAPTMSLLFVDSLPEALRQLASGKANAAIMPKLVGIVTGKSMNLLEINQSPQVIEEYSRPFSFAVKDGDQKLLERLTQGLNIIKSTGQYDVIYKKWFGALEEPHVDWATVIKILSIVALALLGFIVWNFLLRRQVRLQTQHLEAEILQRKQNQEALLESEERYRSMVEEQTELVSRFAPDGAFLYVNQRFCSFFGKRREELIGKSWQPVALEEDLPMIEERLASLSPENSVVSIENRLLNAKGEVRWVQFTNQAFFDDQGSIREVQSVGRDITERKHAEEALAMSEERLSFVLDGSQLGYWDWNLETN